jgi:indole-3-glycerol phosphate synthase
MIRLRSRRLRPQVAIVLPSPAPAPGLGFLCAERITAGMATILDRIVASKRLELAEAKRRLPESELARRLDRAPPVRDFLAALRSPPGMQVIAEVKKASPSAGVIRGEADVVAVAQNYERHGADCISVLTDEPFFQGRLEYLTQIRQHARIPLLRKDFLLDPYQVLEARVAGADAVLLIAEILNDVELADLLAESQRLGMAALVECYEPGNLRRVVKSGAQLIGINNRDLHTFATRLEHTLELAAQVPSDRVLVSESGIQTRADVARLAAAGVKAVLVGETLMRAEDVGAKLKELRMC